MSGRPAFDQGRGRGGGQQLGGGHSGVAICLTIGTIMAVGCNEQLCELPQTEEAVWNQVRSKAFLMRTARKGAAFSHKRQRNRERKAVTCRFYTGWAAPTPAGQAGRREDPPESRRS